MRKVPSNNLREPSEKDFNVPPSEIRVSARGEYRRLYKDDQTDGSKRLQINIWTMNMAADNNSIAKQAEYVSATL